MSFSFIHSHSLSFLSFGFLLSLPVVSSFSLPLSISSLSSLLKIFARLSLLPTPTKPRLEPYLSEAALSSTTLVASFSTTCFQPQSVIPHAMPTTFLHLLTSHLRISLNQVVDVRFGMDFNVLYLWLWVVVLWLWCQFWVMDCCGGVIWWWIRQWWCDLLGVYVVFDAVVLVSLMVGCGVMDSGDWWRGMWGGGFFLFCNFIYCWFF